MELYAFGFNGHGHLSDPRSIGDSATSKENILTPRVILEGQSIKLVWASWCDSLTTVEDSGITVLNTVPTVIYTGTGLTRNQVSKLKSFIDRKNDCVFFGADLQDGIKGVLTRDSTQNLIVFASESEIHSQRSETLTYTNRRNLRLENISMTNGGRVNVLHRFSDHVQGSQYTYADVFESLDDFKAWIGRDTSLRSPDQTAGMKVHEWIQLVSNATTATGLTRNGEVHTWTNDPRYPKCLGRALDSKDENSHTPTVVPYLSETNIIKIASGGYMTAALSSDGELFLWGQACPGTESELATLKPKAPLDGNDDSFIANVNEDDQDEYIKCVSLQIQSRPARATDVAIGSGHVLVAVEAERGELRALTAVFAAGQGGSGQLGIGSTPEFLENFTEVQTLRGKKVKSLTAAGWSSWVVVESD